MFIIEEGSHFIEKTAGGYLNWRNQGREAWGRSWERQRSAQEAAKKLNEKVVEAGRLRAQAELVTSFDELLTILPEGEGVPVSPAKLLELYLTLPPGLRISLIDPVDLNNLYWGGDWMRTSVWRKGETMSAYLVDVHNRVMRSVTISSTLLEAASVYGQTSIGTLSDNLPFGGKIYSAKRFWGGFRSLSNEEQSAIFTDPEMLLQLPKPVIRVGLCPLASAPGYSVIGFESSDYGGNVITSYPVPTSAVEKLIRMLTTRDSDMTADYNASPDSTVSSEDTIGSEGAHR